MFSNLFGLGCCCSGGGICTSGTTCITTFNPYTSGAMATTIMLSGTSFSGPSTYCPTVTIPPSAASYAPELIISDGRYTQSGVYAASFYPCVNSSAQIPFCMTKFTVNYNYPNCSPYDPTACPGVSPVPLSGVTQTYMAEYSFSSFAGGYETYTVKKSGSCDIYYFEDFPNGSYVNTATSALSAITTTACTSDCGGTAWTSDCETTSINRCGDNSINLSISPYLTCQTPFRSCSNPVTLCGGLVGTAANPSGYVKLAGCWPTTLVFTPANSSVAYEITNSYSIVGITLINQGGGCCALWNGPCYFAGNTLAGNPTYSRFWFSGPQFATFGQAQNNDNSCGNCCVGGSGYTSNGGGCGYSDNFNFFGASDCTINYYITYNDGTNPNASYGYLTES